MSTIFDKTVCLSITFRAPGSKRNADLSKVDTDADKMELILSKRIFNSKSYQATHRINLNTRKWLETRSVPSPLRAGTYLIPVGLIDQVNERIDAAIAEYDEAADEFAEEYPTLIVEWQKKLGSQFKVTDYPPKNDIRRRFRVDRMILNFSPARPDEIDQNSEIEAAIEDIRCALRTGLLELVERLSDMVTNPEDGKKKRFSTKALATFQEWMTLFPDRLVVDDDKLKKLADQAKKVLEGKTVDDLKNPGKVRDSVKAGLMKVTTSLKKLLKDAPSRAFGSDE